MIKIIHIRVITLLLFGFVAFFIKLSYLLSIANLCPSENTIYGVKADPYVLILILEALSLIFLSEGKDKSPFILCSSSV